MILWQCSDEDLDEWEEYFIEVFDSRAPSGYNLSRGGKNGFQYTDEVRSKMSESQRKHTYDENHPLPPHMFYYPGRGFAIRPPGKRIQYFRDPTETMESKYEKHFEHSISLIFSQVTLQNPSPPSPKSREPSGT